MLGRFNEFLNKEITFGKKAENLTQETIIKAVDPELQRVETRIRELQLSIERNQRKISQFQEELKRVKVPIYVNSEHHKTKGEVSFREATQGALERTEKEVLLQYQQLEQLQAEHQRLSNN